MSTRSRIGILNENGSVRSVYCHSDGYFSWNGKMLFQHHNSLTAAERIVQLGMASLIYERLDPIGKHSFDAREEGTSVFYARDRGETDCGAQSNASIQDLADSGDLQEYLYLWDKQRGAWVACATDDYDDASLFEWLLLSDIAKGDFNGTGAPPIELRPPVQSVEDRLLESMVMF